MFGFKRSTTKERRRHLRKAAVWTGRVQIGTSGPVGRFTLVDISQGGALLAVPVGTQVEPGNRVVLTVERMGKTPVLFTLSGTTQRVVTAPTSLHLAVELSGAPHTSASPLDTMFEPRT